MAGRDGSELTRREVRTAGATARPGGRWLRRLVVALLVLVVLLVVADRGGDWLAERIAADSLQSSQHLNTRPDVQIEGIPFLTQFAAGDYDHITVDANALPIAKGAFQISHLHVDLNQLTVSRDFETFHASSATADALVNYQDLSRRLGIDVHYAGNGRLRAAKKFTLPGVGPIDPTITVTPLLVDGALGFGKSAINGAGESAGVVSAAFATVFGVRIPLQGIPFQMKVRSLTVDARGLSVKLVGADLTYAKT